MAQRRSRKSGKVIPITINDRIPDDTNAKCDRGDKIQFTALGQACVVVFKEFPLMGLSLNIGQSVVIVVCDTDFAIHYDVSPGTLQNTKIQNAPYRIQSGGGMDWGRKKKKKKKKKKIVVVDVPGLATMAVPEHSGKIRSSLAYERGATPMGVNYAKGCYHYRGDHRRTRRHHRRIVLVLFLLYSVPLRR